MFVPGALTWRMLHVVGSLDVVGSLLDVVG
jgi:hypothetical protein